MAQIFRITILRISIYGYRSREILWDIIISQEFEKVTFFLH